MQLPQLLLLVLLPFLPTPTFSLPHALTPTHRCPRPPGTFTARNGVPAPGTNTRRTDSRSKPPESYQHSQHHDPHQNRGRYSGSQRERPDLQRQGQRVRGIHKDQGKTSRSGSKGSSSFTTEGTGSGPNSNPNSGNNKRVTPVVRSKAMVPIKTAEHGKSRELEYESWGRGDWNMYRGGDMKGEGYFQEQWWDHRLD